jgi:hypothetical protein
MHRNRIASHFNDGPVSTLPLPSERAGLISGGAFCVCPLALAPAPWQQRLYQAAYEQAREAVRQAAFQRLLAVSWN